MVLDSNNDDVLECVICEDDLDELSNYFCTYHLEQAGEYDKSTKTS